MGNYIEIIRKIWIAYIDIESIPFCLGLYIVEYTNSFMDKVWFEIKILYHVISFQS